MEDAKENMFLGAPSDHFGFARELRKNGTQTEEIIWECLRNRKINGHKFRRQHPITSYILDFYCHQAKLAIEIDGEVHNNNAAKCYDKNRDNDLKAQGITTLRFTNNEVNTDLMRVLNNIRSFLNNNTLATPSPTGDGRDEVKAEPINSATT